MKQLLLFLIIAMSSQGVWASFVSEAGGGPPLKKTMRDYLHTAEGYSEGSYAQFSKGQKLSSIDK
jgi:hypothetical protein